MIEHDKILKLHGKRRDPFGALVTRIRVERVEYGRLRLCLVTTCARHRRMILWENPQAKAAIAVHGIVKESAQWDFFGAVCRGERGSFGRVF